MQTEIHERVQYSPDRLLTGFTKTRIVIWVAVAAALHVLLIGMTSVGYLRGKIWPETVEARKAAAATVEKTRAAAATTKTAPAGKTAAAPTTAGANPTEQVPEDRKNAPVVKRITEAAKGDELPKQPGELGISVEDTNPR